MTNQLPKTTTIANFPPYAEVDLGPPAARVSHNAEVIAKEIDRLPPGEYVFRLQKKTAASGSAWVYELSQQTVIRWRELK